MDLKKSFIITVDTEGDNIWERATTIEGLRAITVKNSEFIERFQNICNKYKLYPTYLVDYEMAMSDYFVRMAREWLGDNMCEIGMHMHAWNNPPIVALPFHKRGHNPYVGEYEGKIIEEKVKVITDLLAEKFGKSPISHRGGRWYLDDNYIEVLISSGYKIDCSVTPGISWSSTIGNKIGGTDYTSYPLKEFYLNKNRDILEVPMTIISLPLYERVKMFTKRPYDYNEIRKEKIWLRPTGTNLVEMKYIVDYAWKRLNYVEFMIHSSELMPGGSPTFKSQKEINKMYKDIESLFEYAMEKYRGITLGEYYRRNNNGKVK